MLPVFFLIYTSLQTVPPEVKTMFVFTDDEQWLDAERLRVKPLHPDWKIANLPAPKADVKTISEWEKTHYGDGK